MFLRLPISQTLLEQHLLATNSALTLTTKFSTVSRKNGICAIIAVFCIAYNVIYLKLEKKKKKKYSPLNDSKADAKTELSFEVHTVCVVHAQSYLKNMFLALANHIAEIV